MLQQASVEDEEPDEVSDEEDTLLTPQELASGRSRVPESRNVEDMHALISQLSKALAWDKSIMKVTCQICKRDDNESELLLCDGCDLGFHSYCFRPRMPCVPDADDWFCFVCVALVTRTHRCFICGQLGAGRLRDCSDSLATATHLLKLHALDASRVLPADQRHDERRARCRADSCEHSHHPQLALPPLQ